MGSPRFNNWPVRLFNKGWAWCLVASLILALGFELRGLAQEELRKVHPPHPQEVTEARARILQTFGIDYEGAKTDSAKQAMARRLLEIADRTREAPVNYYVLVTLAKDIAVRGNDYETAESAIERLDERFHGVNALEMRGLILGGRLKSAKLSEKRRILPLVLELLDEALEEDQFVPAANLSFLADEAARSLRDKELREKLHIQKQWMDELRDEFSKIRPAQQALIDDPDDPDANLAVGRYRCLLREQWEEGLPYLARGSEPQLARIAKLELALNADPVEIGDAWWQRSHHYTGNVAKHIRNHAARVFAAALEDANLKTKEHLEERLKRLDPTGEFWDPNTGKAKPAP